ncbi:vanadium-dependent haloperoxidase [Salinimicrobium oceani]|uniref:Vanadium-dependent haloperoxidase n=1 Tax=Salinimicrobium oceani TaxID=2722702 RepID=A0ABX1CVH9_9FLAO|nr:vanadium-dependent haloperoxidase [Salinimicrobium oceani]NJW51915.1 vanadium-dependent haloperoxidase [Salinimicrobium oceani]
MKRFMMYLVAVTACLFIITSCSKDESINNLETAVLSFEPVLKDFHAKNTSKQALGDLPECSDDDPSYVMIVVSQNGTNVVGSTASPFRVDLAPNQDFTVEVPELELSPGQYSLDYFAVHNVAGALIWVAPNGGSLSGLLDHPLPIQIDLNAGVKKYVEVSVMCFDDRLVNEYGYLFFDLDTNEAIEFCFFGNYCDDSGRHFPAAFSVDIWSYSNGALGSQLYSNLANNVSLNNDGDYAGTPLCVALPDAAGTDEYYVEITLLNSDAYGNVTEEVIRSGVISDDDVKALFDGPNALDYFHFREGACNVEDSPELFDDNRVTESYSNDVVIRWNELIAASINQQIPQPMEVKIYAMITLAMHDALNNIVPKYETYALENSEVDATGITDENIPSIADAAVSQAARDMLVQLFPPATAAANDLLSQTLSEIEDSELKTHGIEIGKAAAAAVLAKRAGDPILGFVSYSGGTEPGDYQANYPPFHTATPAWPANAVYGPNLGDLTPFGIQSSDQFMDEAPYPLNSAEYIADYNEVKTIGCNNCPARTAEQTEIGLFWLQTSSGMLNKITRDLIVQKDLDGWEAARLIALIQMATIDAYIASFEEKFHFDFWRPITAIRAGDSDGVDATIGDETWTPFSPVPTPPNPQFPSSHSYAAGAAAEIFKAFFGSDEINLTVTSPFLPGVERQMTSFSQIAHEKGIYGVYIGYDFRYGVEVGEEHGRELGIYLYENSLEEL